MGETVTFTNFNNFDEYEDNEEVKALIQQVMNKFMVKIYYNLDYKEELLKKLPSKLKVFTKLHEKENLLKIEKIFNEIEEDLIINSHKNQNFNYVTLSIIKQGLNSSKEFSKNLSKESSNLSKDFNLSIEEKHEQKNGNKDLSQSILKQLRSKDKHLKCLTDDDIDKEKSQSFKISQDFNTFKKQKDKENKDLVLSKTILDQLCPRDRYLMSLTNEDIEKEKSSPQLKEEKKELFRAMKKYYLSDKYDPQSKKKPWKDIASFHKDKPDPLKLGQKYRKIPFKSNSDEEKENQESN